MIYRMKFSSKLASELPDG